MNAKLNRLQTIGMVAASMLGTMWRNRDYKSVKFIVSLTVVCVTAFLILTAEPTFAQSKRPSGADTNAYFNSERVIRSSGHGGKVDVSGSGFFTDFSDNVRITKDVPEFQLSDTQSGGRLWRLMSGSSAAGSFNIYDNTAGAGTRLTIDTSGNVGIGTTSPGEKLDVVGTFRTTGQSSAPASGAGVEISYASGVGYIQSYDRAAGDKKLHLSGSQLYLNGDGQGNVGIGTTSPASALHVIGGVRDGASNSLNTVLDINRLDAWNNGAGSTLYLNYNGGITSINGAGGNVGIGKANPDVALDVVGDIKASGVIHAKYQDVAEWVESSEQLAAGTVVVLDSTKSNQVISSSHSYDTRVAGVISAQPGITLGEKGDSKVLVATTGRVKVKVDATKSPIQIGDLLVTSDVPGVAMKSQPVELAGRKMHMPGTLIGKALEPLAKGKGEILVLLSLQ